MIQKALTVSKRVRNETAIGNSAVSVPYAAVQLAKQILGSLRDRKVLLLGAGKMGELSARYLLNSARSEVVVVNRTYDHAVELAQHLGGKAVRFEDRWQHLVEADVVISSTSCPHAILGRQEAEIIVRERGVRPLVLIDIALPRDIDPNVRARSRRFSLRHGRPGERGSAQCGRARERGGAGPQARGRRKRRVFAASCWRSAWSQRLWRCAGD